MSDTLERETKREKCFSRLSLTETSELVCDSYSLARLQEFLVSLLSGILDSLAVHHKIMEVRMLNLWTLQYSESLFMPATGEVFQDIYCHEGDCKSPSSYTLCLQSSAYLHHVLMQAFWIPNLETGSGRRAVWSAQQEKRTAAQILS